MKMSNNYKVVLDEETVYNSICYLLTIFSDKAFIDLLMFVLEQDLFFQVGHLSFSLSPYIYMYIYM